MFTYRIYSLISRICR